MSLHYQSLARFWVLTLIVLGGSAQPVSSGRSLNSGEPLSFSYAFSTVAETLFGGSYSFRITVPPGSASLTVRGVGQVPSGGFSPSQFRLLVRYFQDNSISADGKTFVADAISAQGLTPAVVINSLTTPPLRAGTYYISVASSLIGFAGNSLLPLAGTVTATIAGPSPDLTLTQLAAPTQGLIGKRIRASVTIANRGEGPAARSFTPYYFSRDAVITRDDVFSGWGCQTNDSLAVGASWTCTGDIGIPETVPPGTWYLGAIADGENAVAESDETNNTLVASTGRITLNYPVPPGIPASPTALAFSAPADGVTTAAQDLVLTSPLSRQFRLSGSPWLNISQAGQTGPIFAGTAPATLQIRANPAGLAAGHQFGELVVTPVDDPGNSTYIRVGFTITSPGLTGNLAVSPASLTFFYRQGSGDQPRQSLSIAGANTFSYLLSTSEGGDWLKDSSGQGVIVSVDAAGLALGRYRGSVVLFCGTCVVALTRIPVELNVIAGQALPPPAKVSVSGGGQTGAAGALLPLPIVVEALNGAGKPIPDAEVAFSADNASISPPVGRTNSAGQLRAAVTLGRLAGPASISATVNGFAPQTIVATVTGASSVPGPGTGPGTTPPAQVIVTEILDGGSFLGSIAPGGWVTIRGTRLATVTRTWGDADFTGDRLPTSLDGVSVSIGGRAAVVYYVSPSQLNVLAPTGLAATVGAPVVVTNREGTSAVKSVPVVGVRPSFFMLDPEERKYVAGVHLDSGLVGKRGLFITAPDLTRPAPSQGRVLLFGTGWGSTVPDQPDGRAFSDPRPLTNAGTVRITVGGKPAEVEFAGVVSPGLYQFNLVLPDLPAGDHAVVGEMNGIRTQANAFLTIAAAPSPSISAIIPSTAQAGQTFESFTISGQNLSNIRNITFVPSTGIVASVLETSDTRVTARVQIADSAAAGQRSVAVTDGSRVSNSLPFTISVPPPLSISSINPSSAQAGQTIETVTISGRNLSAVNAIVFSPATGLTVSLIEITDTTVTARLEVASNASTGSRSVTLRENARTSNALAFMIAPPPPTISSISPASAEVSEILTEFTVSGQNLGGSPQISFEPSQGIQVLGQRAAGPLFLFLQISNDAIPGERSVTVTTGTGRSNALPFTIRPRAGNFTISNLRATAPMGSQGDFSLTVDFSDPSGAAASGVNYVASLLDVGFVSTSFSLQGIVNGRTSGTIRFDFSARRTISRIGQVKLNLINAQGHRSNTIEGVF